MKNFIQRGIDVDIVVPSGGIVSGRPVVIGSLIGVAAVTADEGDVAVISTEGVFELPKVSAQAWTLGAKIYWDGTNNLATTTTTSNTLIGIAVAAAANPSDTGRVKLGTPT